jgi:hypothetical protein
VTTDQIDAAVVADDAYRQALGAAKAELDAIEPKLQHLLERRSALRQVVYGCSTLLGTSIDPKHDWRVPAEKAGLTMRPRR